MHDAPKTRPNCSPRTLTSNDGIIHTYLSFVLGVTGHGAEVTMSVRELHMTGMGETTLENIPYNG